MRFALLVLLFGCASASADPDARAVPAFHGVDNGAVLDVDITIGSTPKVELTGPKDWVARIVTTVDSEGVLHFEMPGRNNNNPPKLHAQVTMPSLDTLRLSGVGDMNVGKVSTKQMSITLSDVGNLTIAGTTDTLSAHLSGVGDIRARELSAKSADVKVSGTGDAHVRATESVDARVSGMGDIHIAGRPSQVRKKVSGMGDITLE
ncbi:MAG: head GIN domain-containing protein [Kofleriaceae bacterium]